MYFAIAGANVAHASRLPSNEQRKPEARATMKETLTPQLMVW